MSGPEEAGPRGRRAVSAGRGWGDTGAEGKGNLAVKRPAATIPTKANSLRSWDGPVRGSESIQLLRTCWERPNTEQVAPNTQ